MGHRYNDIGYNGHSIYQPRFLGPNETFSMVFYHVKTDLQYKSQNAEVPVEPKQPGPTVCDSRSRVIHDEVRLVGPVIFFGISQIELQEFRKMFELI